MLVRERIAKKEQIMRVKKLNKTDTEKGKRVNRKAEEGPGLDIVKGHGLDRSFDG
jgi:hypothetical protein